MTNNSSFSNFGNWLVYKKVILADEYVAVVFLNRVIGASPFLHFRDKYPYWHKIYEAEPSINFEPYPAPPGTIKKY